MTSTPLGHKKCLDKWGAVQPLQIAKSIEIKHLVIEEKKK
jgi:hypothetical protein